MDRFFRFSAFAIVLAFTSILASAQETGIPPLALVKVRVIDAAGQALPGAIVSVAPGNSQTITDSRGFAQLQIVQSGRFLVQATAQGFHKRQSDFLQLSEGGTLELEIALQKKTVVAEAVVVTATGTEYLSSEAPLRTNLVPASLVDSQVKTSLADALQATIVGVRTEMNCQNCGFFQLRINGLEGPYTQILEDGLPSFSGVAAVYGLEQIPAAFVEQIEVVKGGNSALYGPNAVAGVVNLIRREPVINRLRIDALAGWHRGRPEHQYGAAAQVVELPGGWSTDLYYRGIQRTQIDRDRDGFSDLGRRELQSGGGTAYHSFSDGLSKLSINYTDMAEFRRGGDRFHLPAEQSNITEMVDSRRQTASARWNQTLGPTSFYSLRATYAHLHRNTYYGSGMDPNAYGFTDNPFWVGDAQFGHQLGSHSLLGGYQVANEEVNDVALAYNRRLGGTFRNQGLYIQDEFRPNARLSLIGGIRSDWANTVPRAILSPRAGVKLAVTSNLTWRASVSSGFRAPGVFDEDLHIAQVGGEGFLIQSNASLREQRSVSYSSGLDYTTRWGNRTTRIGASWFRTDLSGVFALQESTNPDSGFRQLLRVNSGDARVAGVEIDGESRLTSHVGLRGGFTWQSARYGVPEPQFQSSTFFRTPTRFGFMSADVVLPLGLDLVATADHTGSMLIPHYAGFIAEDRLEQSKSFLVLNMVLSRTFRMGDRRRMRLFVNGQNIGDNYQPDLDRGPLRDSAYVYGPTEMRRIVIGTTLEF